MQHIKELLEHPTNYSGSEVTKTTVRDEIARRWGPDEASQYDPYSNARTFGQWLILGYRVRKSEKAIRSFTLIEKTDESGKVIKRYKRNILLFYVKQVEKV
jgi:hypothetical protein